MEETVHRPIAVLGITKSPGHVPESIQTLRDSLSLLKNSSDAVITQAEATAQGDKITILEEKQTAMVVGSPDKTEQRNIAYGGCFYDHQNNLMKVQIRSNAIDDPEAAAAFIKRNGFQIAKSRAPHPSAQIQIKNKQGYAGTILASVKAPDTSQKYSIDWEYSYDNGDTWTHSHSTGVCDREISGLTQQSAVIVRARFIIGYDEPLDWMVSNSINI